MVYRKSRIAAMAVAFSLAAGTLAAGTLAAAAPADPLAIVTTRGTADWTGVFAVRADLGGGRLLVERDDAAVRAARELGFPMQVLDAKGTATVYRVVGATGVDALTPRAGRVLWSDATQAVVAASSDEAIWTVAGGPDARIYKVASHAMREPSSPEYAVSDDPKVDEIVSKITAADVSSFDADLVAFGTRHSNEQGGLDAQAYLVQKFQSFGLDQIDQQSVGGVQAKNVCATLPGTTTPDKILVIGGHYDSITSNPANAPGADDNGSGTSGMLAVAKALSGYSFQSTIVFCGYAGEELGLLGSATHAQALADANANVVGMINLDMIGYLAPGDAMDIDVLSNAGSAQMRSLFADVVSRYVSSASQVDGQIPQGASSDHASFWQEGFPALMLFEDSDSYSPYIHTANDTIGTSFNSPALAEEIAKSAGALLATMAVPDSGTSGTPTPTPGVTPTPGNGDNGSGTIHGSGCDLVAAAPATSGDLALAVLLFGLAPAAVLARRRPW